MFYKIDFKCSDTDKIQAMLNSIYNYKEDLSTKIFHRNRINLFYLLMEELRGKNILTSFNSALDIGCNGGFYSKLISDFGFRYVLGIDLSEKNIEIASRFFKSQNKRILEFKVQNAEALDLETKFDFILCTEVIEHTDNPKKMIKIIQQIINPNGIIIISLPNRISLPYLLKILRNKIGRRIFSPELKAHLNYPFIKSMKLFKSKQINILKTSGSNLILITPFLNLLYRTSIFPLINKINFSLSKHWPFKFFTQFFFIILKKKVMK